MQKVDSTTETEAKNGTRTSKIQYKNYAQFTTASNIIHYMLLKYSYTHTHTHRHTQTHTTTLQLSGLGLGQPG